MMLIAHEFLAFWLLYTGFCRAVKMGPQTELAIRMAFWALDIAAAIAVFAPARGWEPDYVSVILLLAINVVQTTTAMFWRQKAPEQFARAATEETA